MINVENVPLYFVRVKFIFFTHNIIRRYGVHKDYPK